MNFSQEQLEIIEAPLDEKTIVMATAASGKTRTLIERLKYVIKNGIDPSKIVVLTFTNNAAAEMRDRLGADALPGMFMGTIHSYANYLLTSHGYNTAMIRDEEEFDELFDMIEEHPEVLRPVDYLLCDESQDLNPIQFNFISDIIDPVGTLITGDVRQSIYGFRGAEPKMMLKLMRRDDYVIRELTQNYRNSKKIIELSNKILDRMKNIPSSRAKGMRGEIGKVQIIGPYDILNTVKKDPVWKNWAILCRTNKKVDSIMGMLTRAGIPCITFRQAQGSLDDLKEKMNENAIKVLTIHSSKGLEFNKVIVCDTLNKGQDNIRLNYVAVTRAKDELFLVGR